ncbi:cytochrome c family protein [Massilia sp. AB1]|uniref:c-type cytochrome n=1 Tax=Massilia sp. AB1 TaxID=2823371 RepID=UPI001B832139|nr:cytochrome c family protein [Massilia sp. AB1]MBQ5940532.1 cytochrome c family protein [Massilia sp. AB1]
MIGAATRAAAAALALVLAACGREQPVDQVEAGRKVFARCANCHQVGPGARNLFGPELNGIIGRRAGGLPGYAYSPALKQAGFTWDEAKLAAFVRDPEQVVPGNAMRFWGLSDERQVANLLAYLRSHPAQ